MNLNDLKALNPNYSIYDITDAQFKTYGRIVEADLKEAIDYVNSKDIQSGYIASDPSLENISSIQSLGYDVFGNLDFIAGIVSGNNHVLNGIEYHQCSEVIVAVSDYVLVVGHRWDMENETYDSQKCECFYVPQGTIVECYSTTLHYTPICLSDDGFKTICLLLKGTGDNLPRPQVGILKKKNKWFIAHPENIEKVKLGDVPGLKGNMIKIKYKEGI